MLRERKEVLLGIEETLTQVREDSKAMKFELWAPES